MKTNLWTKKSKFLAFIAGVLLIASNNSIGQTIYVPQSAPYAPDASTVLLEHFNGTTTGATNGTVFYTNGVFGQGVHLNDSSWVGWAIGSLANGTIEFWGNLDTLTNGVGAPAFVWAYISPSYVGQGPGETLTVNVLSSDSAGGHSGMPGAGIVPAPGSGLGAGSNSIVIATNTWHHYALTWGTAGLHFYIDGALVGSNSPGALYSATDYWIAGNGNGNGFNGVIDELRISNIQRIFSPGPALTIKTAVEIDWTTVSNQTYQLQTSTDLTNWTNLGGAIVGTGSATNQHFSTSGTGQFFRLNLQ